MDTLLRYGAHAGSPHAEAVLSALRFWRFLKTSLKLLFILGLITFAYQSVSHRISAATGRHDVPQAAGKTLGAVGDAAAHWGPLLIKSGAKTAFACVRDTVAMVGIGTPGRESCAEVGETAAEMLPRSVVKMVAAGTRAAQPVPVQNAAYPQQQGQAQVRAYQPPPPPAQDGGPVWHRGWGGQ